MKEHKILLAPELKLENQPKVLTSTQHRDMVMQLGTSWPLDLWPALEFAKTLYSDVFTTAGLPVTSESLTYFDGCLRYGLLNFQQYMIANKQSDTRRERSNSARGMVFEALAEAHLKEYGAIYGQEVHSDIGYISKTIAATYPKQRFGKARFVEMPISGYIQIDRSEVDVYKGFKLPVCHGLPDFLVWKDPNSYVVVEATTLPIGIPALQSYTETYIHKKLTSISYYLNRRAHERPYGCPDLAGVVFLLANRDESVDKSSIRSDIYSQWRKVNRSKQDYSFEVETVQVGTSFRMLVDAVLSELERSRSKPK